MGKKIAFITVSAVLGMALAASGCGKEKISEKGSLETTQTSSASSAVSESNKEQPEESQKTDPTLEAEPASEAEAENVNLLTGLDTLSPAAIGKRPVAVMVNNVTPSLPQYGVEKADLIFELPVEGDLTRLMAVYGDMTEVPQVCSVRSCRYYYPILAVGFDAFYVHWGMDDTIGRDTINSLEIDHLEGMNNDYTLFGRDQSRIDAGFSREHTAYFDGTRFAQEIGEARTELKPEKRGFAFSFNGKNEMIRPDGDPCTQAVIDFGASSSVFDYDASANTYKMSHNGEPQIDANTNQQLSYTNVFILETDISVRDDVGRKNIDWQGGDDSVGYYISNGAVQKIHWSKPGEYDYLKFTDLEGNELKINRGKSYIAFNYYGKESLNG